MSICTLEEFMSRVEYWGDGYYEKATDKYIKRTDKEAFPLDKGSNNYTYFGYICGIPNGAWCAMMISTCVLEACKNSKTDAKYVLWGVWPYAACNQLYDAAPSNAKGRRGSWKPQRGDIMVVSYNGTSRDHTETVYKVDGTYVYTYGGNVSNRSQKVTRKLTDSTIYGYIRPRFADSKPAKEECTVKTYVLKRGCTGIGVRSLQAALNANGCDCGKVDGDFGEATEKAVKKFQAANGLKQDGEAGSDTLAKLWRID